MNNKEAYNTWAANYDTVLNKTRDLEAAVIRKVIREMSFAEILEIGCGIGRNTEWLANKATHLTAVDFSNDMLAKAKNKIKLKNIEFKQADINGDWTFINTKAGLITCSLVLEHINDLDFIFSQANNALINKGFFILASCIRLNNMREAKPVLTRETESLNLNVTFSETFIKKNFHQT